MQTKILVLRKNRLLIGLFLLVAAALLVFLLSRISEPSSSNNNPNRSSSGNVNSGSAYDYSSQDVVSHGTSDRTVEDFYQSDATYRAGVYTCGISLNDTVLSLEVVLDKDHINSIRLINLEESVATMYPLVEPALNALAEQLTGGVMPEDVELSEDTKYTQLLLMEVINQTLAKAAIE